MAEKFYITAAIPYVNAKPHIGHALEFVQTDVIARYQRMLRGDARVIALSGGDENALKNVQAAEAAGIPIQEFVDRNTGLFHNLAEKLNVQFDVWQKGSDRERHYKSSQQLWKLCDRAGDIYKKTYKGLYCVGCEAFYEKEDLNEKGECDEHPGKKLEEVEEENYFFRLGKYQEQLTRLIESGELEIVPEERKNEILSFVRGGLKDISISRSNERARDWGVPVPNDDSSRIYVWMDALNIYQTGVGFGWNEENYNKWWPADVHVIGKGITRFHTVYWPAFLLSAGLKLPKKILVHGYYTVDGQKMSKTTGNVYDPAPLLDKYGTDGLRYYCLAKTPTFTDGDFSEEKFTEGYNADLANGLGNLVARIAKLAEKAQVQGVNPKIEFDESVAGKLEAYRFDEAIKIIWSWISDLDRKIEEVKPWTLEGESLAQTIRPMAVEVAKIAYHLQPFLPETAQKVLNQFGESEIKARVPLFPRIK